MTDRIIKILQSEKIDKYCIYEERRESAELFLVKKKADLMRGKDTRDVKLTLYREFNKEGKHCLGSVDVFLYSEMDDVTMQSLIRKAYKSTLYADNPYYELPSGSGACEDYPDEIRSLNITAVKMAKALYLADIDENAWINSAEIFALRNTVHITNSNGVDVKYVKESVKGEFVVQSRLNGNDVELIRQFEYDSPDEQALRRKCEDAIQSVKDRAIAVKAPEDLSAYPLILCDDTVGEFLTFYTERCNASYIYPGYSDYECEKDVCPDAAGDKISIDIMADVPYSCEGVEKNDHTLIENGIIKTLHGNHAYSSYLGIESIGEYNRIRCNNRGTDEEVLKEPYIMVKSFSDFQMDAMDGSFGGEFRLAYLCENGRITPVTGQSVSKNMFEAHKNMIFSAAMYNEASYSGPAMVRIK